MFMSEKIKTNNRRCWNQDSFGTLSAAGEMSCLSFWPYKPKYKHRQALISRLSATSCTGQFRPRNNWIYVQFRRSTTGEKIFEDSGLQRSTLEKMKNEGFTVQKPLGSW